MARAASATSRRSPPTARMPRPAASSVTNDLALDWSPTWSPDGRFLYFSSTRGGTMNLWRVPIDERSGPSARRPHSRSSPPSTWSGEVSFSRDGSRFVFASLDFRSTILRVAFDAARGTLVGAPSPILKSNLAIRDHELSPDGSWIAFTTSGPQEDLFVAQRRRQRLPPPDRRRLPRPRAHWSPDGSHIAFYSDRSGTYECVDAFGRRQRPRSADAGDRKRRVSHLVASRRPHRRRVHHWRFIDPTKTSSPAEPGEPERRARARHDASCPSSWSSDGQSNCRPRGRAVMARMLDWLVQLATRRQTDRRMPGPWAGGVRSALSESGSNDSQHLIVRRPEGVGLVDANTGDGRVVVAVEGLTRRQGAGVSRDNRWISYTETATEGDIWTGTLKP